MLEGIDEANKIEIVRRIDWIS